MCLSLLKPVVYGFSNTALLNLPSIPTKSCSLLACPLNILADAASQPASQRIKLLLLLLLLVIIKVVKKVITIA
jgi:hypothetical protein